MLQIRTIKNRLDNATDFDKEVSQALQEGWRLARRDVLMPQSQSDRSVTYIMLYAELVKETITEDEKNCQNCKHGDKAPDEEPCRNCSDNGDKWEPADA